jgi:hypothetical protein
MYDAGEDVPPSLVTATRVVSGRSKPVRTEFPTGTRMCRSSDGAHSLLRQKVCA